jgi:hypothetical protein
VSFRPSFINIESNEIRESCDLVETILRLTAFLSHRVNATIYDEFKQEIIFLFFGTKEKKVLERIFCRCEWSYNSWENKLECLSLKITFSLVLILRLKVEHLQLDGPAFKRQTRLEMVPMVVVAQG